MDDFINQIVEQQIEQGKIAESKRAEYCHWYLKVFQGICVCLLSIAISVAFQIYWQIVLFYLLLIPLKIFAGGYRADTIVACTVITCVSLMLYIIAMDYSGGHSMARYAIMLEGFIMPCTTFLVSIGFEGRERQPKVKHSQIFVSVIYKLQFLCELVAICLGYIEFVSCCVITHFILLCLLIIGMLHKSDTDIFYVTEK